MHPVIVGFLSAGVVSGVFGAIYFIAIDILGTPSRDAGSSYLLISLYIAILWLSMLFIALPVAGEAWPARWKELLVRTISALHNFLRSLRAGHQYGFLNICQLRLRYIPVCIPLFTLFSCPYRSFFMLTYVILICDSTDVVKIADPREENMKAPLLYIVIAFGILLVCWLLWWVLIVGSVVFGSIRQKKEKPKGEEQKKTNTARSEEIVN